METTREMKKGISMRPLFMVLIGISAGAIIAISLFLTFGGSLGTKTKVQAAGFDFNPAEIRVKAGEEITLDLNNSDSYRHSFDVDELDIHEAMPANYGGDLSFAAETPGEYTFYCSVPGHIEAGMIGTLIVEP